MFRSRKTFEAMHVYTIEQPVLLSVKPLENSQDEGFLIGRREMSVCNLKYRTHSHIRITEVAPSNSAIINGKSRIFFLYRISLVIRQSFFHSKII